MARGSRYDYVMRYHIEAVTREPLHVGAATGEPGEVLIHPVERIPFIQATSIAGVFRQHWEDSSLEYFFGSAEQHEQSRIHFEDVYFDRETLALERRPRLSINPEKGVGSGNKFEMSYISEGVEFSMLFYVFCHRGDVEKAESEIRRVLGMMHNGAVQFGGQKTNGCGYVALKKVFVDRFDMTDETDRKRWQTEEYRETEDVITEICRESGRNRYQLVIHGTVDGSILVKGIGEEGFGKETADAAQLKSRRGGKEEYILPASSVKGTCKNQAFRILSFLKREEDYEALTSGMYFYDAVVKGEAGGRLPKIQHRIRIDKFTGSVMNGGLFSQRPVNGDVDLRMEIADDGQAFPRCGLMLYVARDIMLRLVSFGSGRNIGQGYLDVDFFELLCPDGRKVRVTREAVADEDGIVPQMLHSLREGGGQDE